MYQDLAGEKTKTAKQNQNKGKKVYDFKNTNQKILTN